MTTTYNVNIVGNLTNNDGVLSGFSSGNYATVNQAITLGNNFEILVKCTTGTNTASSVMKPIFYKGGYLAINIYNRQLDYNWGNGGDWSGVTYTGVSRTPQDNTTYYFKITYNGSRISFNISTDGTNFQEAAYKSASITIPSAIYDIGSEGGNYSFNGSIDLNECYIKIDDNLVWEGSTVTPEPTGTTPKIGTNDIQKVYLGSQEISKIYLGCEVVYEASTGPIYNVNIVGNLTNSNGILSGFSSSNYATFARPTFNNTFEIGAKITTGNNVSDLQIVYCPDTDQHGVRFEVTGGKFGLLAGANGAWINTSNYTGGSVSPNTNYYLKASFNGSIYKLEISTDGISYNTVVSYNSSTKVTNGFTDYLLGTYLDHNLGLFGGTIDLNYCYVKIDDNIVWNGVIL